MAKRQFWTYSPSIVPAIIFAVLYVGTAVVTVYQYITLRCWFWIFMVIASLMESIGYISRIISVKNQTSSAPYVVQFLLIFLAPAVMAASCYMAMGRVVLHVTPMRFRSIKTLWVTPRWMTPIFVAFDCLAFMIQVVGGILATGSGDSKKKLGYSIMKIGVSVQLVCFGLFLVISLRFHFVAKRFRDSWPDTRWINFLYAINVSCSLIFIRSAYRLVEFVTGFDGYLANHEWNFYIFEAAVVFPVFVIFNVLHPAKYVSNTSWKQKRTDEELQSTVERA